MGLATAVSANTIQAFPQREEAPRLNSWILELATVADSFSPWGRNILRRDRELRAFWPSEPIVAGAVATVCARNASQSIVFDGPARTVKAVQEMWNGCDFGKGPQHLLMKVSTDLYTQDNGAFVEIIREDLIDGEEAMKRIEDGRPLPIVESIAHLDAARCRRTGIPLYPVIYTDRDGVEHKIAWHNVVMLAEMPSPVETMNGAQYCALTRILRAAQLMRDIGVMDTEKAAGRFVRRVHLVGGVQTQIIEDKLAQQQERADNQGLLRHIEHVIIGSLDPTAQVNVASLDLASLPDDLDRAEAFRQYIAILALGFLEDYQTFAPLPGGSLGTSQQSQILHLKAKGKGPGIFSRLLIHALMYNGILPRSVEASIEEKDVQQELDEAQARGARANTRAQRITSGEITPQIARQIANDEGDLDDEYLALLDEEDVTEDVTATDEQRAESPAEMQEEVGGALPEQIVKARPGEGKGRWITTRTGNRVFIEDDGGARKRPSPARPARKIKHPQVRRAIADLPDEVQRQIGKIHEIGGRAFQNAVWRFGGSPDFVAFRHIGTGDLYVDMSRVTDPALLQRVRGTIHHEAGHAVHDKLLSPAERKTIKADYDRMAKRNDDFASFNAVRNAEEYFAEAYRAGHDNDWYGVQPSTRKIVQKWLKKRQKAMIRTNGNPPDFYVDYHAPRLDIDIDTIEENDESDAELPTETQAKELVARFNRYAAQFEQAVKDDDEQRQPA